MRPRDLIQRGYEKRGARGAGGRIKPADDTRQNRANSVVPRPRKGWPLPREGEKEEEEKTNGKQPRLQIKDRSSTQRAGPLIKLLRDSK